MLNEIRYYFYHSQLSALYLTICDSQIVKLEYEPDNLNVFKSQLQSGDIKTWLDAYFCGQPLKQFPDLQIKGTDFQQKVWRVMLAVPFGKTLSYGEVSTMLGSAPRAVGQACKRNNIPIFIPCHRIVAKHSLGGYEGATEGHRLDRKKWLINHERNYSASSCI